MGVWLKLNGCCFCFSLRTGSLITLWLGLIYSTLGLVEAVYGIQSLGNAAPEMMFFSIAHCAGVVTLGIMPCTLGLYGVYKRASGYLKLYVFISFVTIIVWVSITVALAFHWIELYHYKDSIWPVSSAIILASVIHWYFTSVIHSYYQQLRRVFTAKP